MSHWLFLWVLSTIHIVVTCQPNKYPDCPMFNEIHSAAIQYFPQHTPRSNTQQRLSDFMQSAQPTKNSQSAQPYTTQPFNQSLSSHKYTQRTFDRLGICNEQQCFTLTRMTPKQITQMLKQDWPHFMKALLQDTAIDDQIIWILFDEYAKSKWQYWNQYDIASNHKNIVYALAQRNKLKNQQTNMAAIAVTHAVQQQMGSILLHSKNNEQLQQKIISTQQALTNQFGCDSAICCTIIENAVQLSQTNGQQLLPQILPKLIAQHRDEFGLLPAFQNCLRTQTLGFGENSIPSILQLPANYFFATIQDPNAPQLSKFIAQKGLESIALVTTGQDNTTIFTDHAQQMYQELLNNKFSQCPVKFEPNPNILQEIQNLEKIYQVFHDREDDQDILSQRYEALHSTLQNSNQMNPVIAPANVLGFMQAHGLDHSMLLTYQQNAAQQQISAETIQIIQQAMQVDAVTPLIMVTRSLRLFHQSIGEVSQQTLLYSRLGQIADAFESADINWCLVTYGPDMIAGAFDCVITPIQLTAIVAVGVGKIITHPLKTLQQINNGLAMICDGTRTIGHKLYDGAAATGHYAINHNPKDWYDDTNNLCTRSIDIAWNVKNQACDYIKTIDSHKAVQTISSAGAGWFMMPLVQARTGIAVTNFTNSIKAPLLEKTIALQTACAVTLTKGMQQTKQLSYKIRNDLQQFIKKTDTLIQDLLPQPELAAQTPYGDIIKISGQPTLIQNVKGQLFLFSEIVKNKTNSIISMIAPNNFAKYDRSDIVLSEVINSSGIRQIELWRQETNNFKHLSNLQEYHKLYLNYAYWLHQELQPLQNQINKLNLSFRHGGRLHQITSIDLLHIFLGDILPKHRKVSGMHHLSKLTKQLYHCELTSLHQSSVKKINVFRKNNGMQVGAYKLSSLFPTSWDIKKCFQKAMEALQNKPFLEAQLNETSIIIKGRTTCGINIGFIYDPITQNIKSFYPMLKGSK